MIICFVQGLTGVVFMYRLEKEILDRYLDVVLKGNKVGLKVIPKFVRVIHIRVLCDRLYFI